MTSKKTISAPVTKHPDGNLPLTTLQILNTLNSSAGMPFHPFVSSRVPSNSDHAATEAAWKGARLVWDDGKPTPRDPDQAADRVFLTVARPEWDKETSDLHEERMQKLKEAQTRGRVKRLIQMIEDASPLSYTEKKSAMTIYKDVHFYMGPSVWDITWLERERLMKWRWQDHPNVPHLHLAIPCTPDVTSNSDLWKVGNRQLLKGNKFPEEVMSRLMWSDRYSGKTAVLDFFGIGLQYLQILNPVLSNPGRHNVTVILGNHMAQTDINVPFWFRMTVPYFRATYTTDQDTECALHHRACTVCSVCYKRVLCEFKDCVTCNDAIALTLTEIIGWDSIRGRRSVPHKRRGPNKRDWYPTDIKDVLYHQLIVAQEGPASAYSRFPFERSGFNHEEWTEEIGTAKLRVHNDIDSIWPAQENRKSQEKKFLGANPYYNQRSTCKMCETTFVRANVKVMPQPCPVSKLDLWSIKVHGNSFDYHERYGAHMRVRRMIKEVKFDHCSEHQQPPNVVLPTGLASNEALRKLFCSKVKETIMQEDSRSTINQLRFFPPVQGSLFRVRRITRPYDSQIQKETEDLNLEEPTVTEAHRHVEDRIHREEGSRSSSQPREPAPVLMLRRNGRLEAKRTTCLRCRRNPSRVPAQSAETASHQLTTTKTMKTIDLA